MYVLYVLCTLYMYCAICIMHIFYVMCMFYMYCVRIHLFICFYVGGGGCVGPAIYVKKGNLEQVTAGQAYGERETERKEIHGSLTWQPNMTA